MIEVNVNSPAEVYAAGIKALAEALDPVCFARFMRQVQPGRGDYTKEKYLTPEPSVEEMERELKKYI